MVNTQSPSQRKRAALSRPSHHEGGRVKGMEGGRWSGLHSMTSHNLLCSHQHNQHQETVCSFTLTGGPYSQFKPVIPTAKAPYSQFKPAIPTGKGPYSQFKPAIPTGKGPYSQFKPVIPTGKRHYSKFKPAIPTGEREYFP